LNSGYGDGPIVTRIDGVGVGNNNVSISEETENAILRDEFDGTIIYKPGRAPINVNIYNPLEVVNGEFELTFSDLNGNNDGNDDLDTERYWQLTDLSDPSNPILSEQTIDRLNEQILTEYGFSIKLGQTDDVGDDPQVNPTNGLISYNETYAESANWFSYTPDDAGVVFNYLRTGETEPEQSLDPNGAFSSFGAFVPYTLASFDNPNPLPDFWFTPALRNPALSGVVRLKNGLDKLNNVDIVFTNDKSQWSRCIVVETAIPEYYNSPTPSGNIYDTEGDAENLRLRKGNSVDENGNSDGTGTGMGYFPGYAVDQETGERLNIFFGENSVYHPDADFAENYEANGRDMIWNPTDERGFNTQGNFTFPYNLIAGGQHYIYVTREKYDGCATLQSRLEEGTSVSTQRKAYEQITWTSMALLSDGSRLLPIEEGLIPTDLRIELRVDNPYQVFEGTNDFNGYPTYRFKLEGVAAEAIVEGDAVETALDNINVVPNPYYGYSAYEISQFANTIKITNLPAKCNVTIYSLDGKFIRQYKRDEIGVDVIARNPSGGINTTQVSPALEWDLKNNKGIPIASGVYLIHIDADGLGERVIKWFGVARKFDPSGL